MKPVESGDSFRLMKKAVIFDNDGVLVDTESRYFQATDEFTIVRVKFGEINVPATS